MVINRMGLIFFLLLAALYGDSDLDAFLRARGFHLHPAGTAVQEGYITPEQKQIFIGTLKSHPEIRHIAEVGFNAGHSAEIFLEHIPASQIVSFDINAHQYTPVGVEFMKAKYKDRFLFVEGDSRYSIRNFFYAHREAKFDLIYIDGCHQFGACLEDLLNFKSLAHPHSLVWVDDFNFPEVKRAVEFAEKLRILRVVNVESVEDELGIRSWVECCYLF